MNGEVAHTGRGSCGDGVMVAAWLTGSRVAAPRFAIRTVARGCESSVVEKVVQVLLCVVEV